MTSRERMKKFFAGEAVDRVPNAWGGCETAGTHMLGYDNLKKILGVTDPTARMYTFMSNAVFEPTVLDAMDGDMLVLNSKMCPAPLWGPGAEGRWKEHSMWGMNMQVPNDLVGARLQVPAGLHLLRRHPGSRHPHRVAGPGRSAHAG
jgi:hypothetical protein